MTRETAREILSVVRLDGRDDGDPLVREALALADRDSELGAWWRTQSAMDQRIAALFRQEPVPESLKAVILAEERVIVRVPFWRQYPRQWAAAAAILILAGTGLWWSAHRPAGFRTFEDEILEATLTSPASDGIRTTDLNAIRQWIVDRGGNGDDLVLPATLKGAAVTWALMVDWRGHRIPAVSLTDHGRHLYLYVADRHLFSDPPAERQPTVANVNKFAVLGWTQGDRTYLMTGMSTRDFVRRFHKTGSQWGWDG